MTKQQLINELKAIGSEYMYQDIGYGGFYGEDNTFMAIGIVYQPTKTELQDMLDSYYRENGPSDEDLREFMNYAKEGNL